MNGVPIRRYGRRTRRSRRLWRCGCSTLLISVMLMICAWLCGLRALMPILLLLTGADSLGNTDDLFTMSFPVATEIMHNRRTVSEDITIWLGLPGSENLRGGTDASVSTGNADDGTRMAQVSFTELGLMNICHRHTMICLNGNGLYRDVRIDLRPAGAVIYLDAGVGFSWHQVGVVLQLDGARTRFDVAGVDVNGVVYDPTSLPFGLDGFVSDAIEQIRRQGNELLRDLTVGVNGEQFRLYELVIDDTTLTLTLR